MKISVSFLSDKYDKIDILKKINSTDADYIHVDVMDGKFVDNVNMPYEEAIKLMPYFTKKLDVHLMVSDLDKYINEYIKLKPEFITFHVESTEDVMKYIRLVKNNNIKCGLSINPETKIDEVLKYLPFIDLILIMSVEPGKGGQKFIPDVLEKVAILKNIINSNNYDCLISIDGGINEKTYLSCVHAKVDMMVSGSFLHGDDMQQKIDLLRKN